MKADPGNSRGGASLPWVNSPLLQRWLELRLKYLRERDLKYPREGDFAAGLRADDDGKISQRARDGSLYVDMVATSRWVFLPAVVIALIGFVTLLLGTDDKYIWVLSLIGLALALGYASIHRPDLGAD